MKTKTKCPECGGHYVSLSRHLRDRHDMKDDKQRRLFISKKHLRYGGRLRCPIKDCGSQKDYARLDKHLISAHGRTRGKRMTKLMTKAKKAAIKEKLRTLYQTPPPLQTPPLPAPPTQPPGTPSTNPAPQSPPPPALPAQTGALSPPPPTLTFMVNGLHSIKDRLKKLLEEVELLQTVTQQLCALYPATASASTASSPCSTPTSHLQQPAASTSSAPETRREGAVAAPSSAPYTRREGAVAAPSSAPDSRREGAVAAPSSAPDTCREHWKKRPLQKSAKKN
ncbi:proteoglycan 4-like [Toxotes jaculatrix]|uniref:proteoglycan 4-like n=1 Tax=Toxotes jaculatrix TaxID=941984 RepID=UPI001B3B09D7|nr:proteoglycan 4-like [Toxotes jaculatrix]